MNWNDTCAARTARRSEAIPTSGAIWWRCADQDHGERSAIDVVAGRAMNSQKEAEWNAQRKLFRS